MVHLMGGINVVSATQADGRQPGAILLSDHAFPLNQYWHTLGRITFRWKDYAHGNKKRKMTISAHEFLRRFLLHTLPRGFVRIRFFGFMAGPRRSHKLRIARRLLETEVVCDVLPAATKFTTFHCPLCATTGAP